MDKPGEYNCIFDKLVLNAEPNTFERLAGMVAYSKYKLKKNEFCQKYYEDNQEKPSEQDIYLFISTFNERELEELRGNAADMMAEFADTYLEESREDIINNSVVSEVKKQNGFWSNLWQNFLSSMIFSFVAFIALTALVFAKEDWNVSKIFRSLVNDNIHLQVIEKNTKEQDSINYQDN